MSARKKVFVSFDFDNDKLLKDFLIGQSRLEHSPFEVYDYSLKEASKEKEWEVKARNKIERADLVIVMLGEHTHKSPGVLKEVAIARSLHKKIIQVIGHKHSKYQRIKGAGYLYQWNWENLQKVLEK
ncbi:MAG TPA: TIR domain-containing protein [Cytophagaceae bacterium]|jgi:hypothetical protein|nr:TIR domain-containing protein [Cytophagaceae bacterium]